jgi:Endonuclease/Exonuclease/phosphatase family
VIKIAAALILWVLLASSLSSTNDEIEIRVMTFNIWYGGEQVSFAQTAEVVRAVRPDLVGIQEPDGNLRALAQAAGFSYVDEKRNIISRYPLFDPDSKGKRFPYTFALVRPGHIVAFANAHLTSTPFGPDLLREGKSTQEVLQIENEIRLTEIQQYIKPFHELITRGIPIFFAGDFNSPSHLDKRYGVEWPVTKALAGAGLRDSYREAHPNPNQHPGLTYTPGYPHPYIKRTEILERIDMIWTAGNSSTVESKIIGEANNPAVDVAIDPYPSDHRAIVSTFKVVPASAPSMIAVDSKSIMEGNDFVVRFSMPNFADWRIAIVPSEGDPKGKTIIAANGVMSTRPSIKFGSIGVKPGAYDAVLLDSKQTELARTTFYILAKNSVPELRIQKAVYKSGEPIEVSWRNAPGMKNDWIGVYRAGDPDLYTGYISYIYTGATIEGSASLPQTLAPSEYELRLMREDSYVTLAKTSFSVSD